MSGVTHSSGTAGPPSLGPVTPKCSGIRPTHLTIDYPMSDFYPIQPTAYSCGFSRDGRIIGSNLPVPYPRDQPWYHDIPFRRLVDWFSPAVIGDHEKTTWDFIRKKDKKRPGGFVDGCDHCRLSETSAQTKSKEGTKGCGRHEDGKGAGCLRRTDGSDQKKGGEEEEEEEDGVESTSALTSCCQTPYPPTYLVDNDPSYKAWVDGKADVQMARDKLQAEIRKVPWEIKLYPGHHAPPIRRTTNETYGHHLDMRPKFPLVYPEVKIEYKPAPLVVRYRRSNMSDHPPIPDHAFAVPPSELVSQDGSLLLRGINGAPYKPDQGGLGDTMKIPNPEDVGLKDKSEKAKRRLPTKTHEATQATVVSGEGVKPPAPCMPDAHEPWTFRRSAVMLGRVVGERRRASTWPVFTPTGLELNRTVPRHVNMSCGHRHLDKPIEQVKLSKNCGVYDLNAAKLTQRTGKELCRPREPAFSGFSKSEPCHRDFVNPEYLSVPGGWREFKHCKPSTLPLPCDDPKARNFHDC